MNKPKVYKRGSFWYVSVPPHLPTGWGSFDTAVYWVGCYYMNPEASTKELNRMTNQYLRRLVEG